MRAKAQRLGIALLYAQPGNINHCRHMGLRAVLARESATSRNQIALHTTANYKSLPSQGLDLLTWNRFGYALGFLCSLLVIIESSHFFATKNRSFGPVSREATTGFGPVIRVLQTHALPLGYVAILNSSCWTRTNDTAVNSRVLYRLS